MPDDDKTPSSSEMVSLFSKRKHSDGVEPGSGGVVDDTEAHQLQAQVLAPDFGSDLEANPPLKPKNPDVKGKYTGTEHVQEYDVFADTSEDGPNYRNVGLIATTILMFKTQVGIGVLSLPSALHTLGIVPGTLTLIAVTCLSTWGMFILGNFKTRYPQVYSFADAGFIIAGEPGRWICSIAYWFYMTIIAGSGLLSISIALNSISLHGTCTAVFMVVATICAFLLASIQTLEKISWVTYSGFVSLIVSLLVVTVGVAVNDRPAAAPSTGPWSKDLKIVNDPTFAQAISAVSQQLLAVGLTPALFSIKSEMRNPALYNRALTICQLFTISFYISISIVVYYYCGQYVATPAFGSAGLLIKRISYGLAIPALLISCTLYTHLPAKWLFVIALRGSEHLTRNTTKHWVVWLSCVLGCVLFSYVIASAVPVFSGLVGLVGALFGAFLCIIVTGCMWLYDYGGNFMSQPPKQKILTVLNVLLVLCGTFLMVAGTYGSVMDIKDSFEAGDRSTPWGCEDNSNTVKEM